MGTELKSMADTCAYVMDMAYRYNPADVAHIEQDAYPATKIFRLTRQLKKSRFFPSVRRN